MAEPELTLRIVLDGHAVHVRDGTTVAAVVAEHATVVPRAGVPPTPLCGMGICFGCGATVDGRPEARTCTIACREGMEVHTGA